MGRAYSEGRRQLKFKIERTQGRNDVDCETVHIVHHVATRAADGEPFVQIGRTFRGRLRSASAAGGTAHFHGTQRLARVQVGDDKKALTAGRITAQKRVEPMAARWLVREAAKTLVVDVRRIQPEEFAITKSGSPTSRSNLP
jgi:hypothetical protein